MAKQKGGVDLGLVDRIAAELEALDAPAPPPGFPARLRSPVKSGDRGRIKKALPHILKGLIEVGLIAADGQVSADELRKIVGGISTLFRGLRKPDGRAALLTDQEAEYLQYGLKKTPASE